MHNLAVLAVIGALSIVITALVAVGRVHRFGNLQNWWDAEGTPIAIYVFIGLSVVALVAGVLRDSPGP